MNVRIVPLQPNKEFNLPRKEIFDKFKKGTLKSSSGKKVTSEKQAIAIALSYKK